MATPRNPNALLAADTNVPLDLAEGKEHVLDALAVLRRRLTKGRLLIPPTAFQELVFLAEHADAPTDRALALRALRGLASWGFEIVNLVPVAHGIVERIAERLVGDHLLPAEEFNDALILAEAALLDCSILLSSDEHLRSLDFENATLKLREFDVTMPIIATPREIVRKFF